MNGFNAPVTTQVREKLLSGLVARFMQACDSISDLMGHERAVQLATHSLDAEGDLGMGEFEVIGKLSAQMDLAPFDPAVALVGSFRLREKKNPNSGPECPRQVLVDCF